MTQGRELGYQLGHLGVVSESVEEAARRGIDCEEMGRGVLQGGRRNCAEESLEVCPEERVTEHMIFLH